MKKLQIITVLLAGIVSQYGQAEQSRQLLDQDGVAREYQLYIPPSYQKSQLSPLLIVLHGRTSNGQRMADLTSFNSRADKYGFVVVYPEGIHNQWNYLHGIAGFKDQPNDADFLLKVAAAVESKYSIDKKRVYVAGLSNGGFMTQRLACYAPGKFTAFASVAAGGYAAMPIECVNRGPVNMLYIHGTADEKVPWEGLAVTDGDGSQQLVTISITNSVKFWANRNQCSPDVVSKNLPPKGNSPGTRVKILSSNDCMGNAEVVLYAIIGGGHNWPGAPGIIPPSIAGRVNMDIHASDVIWSFFSTKSLR
jgi:polyhydroxybutyrate depolymerase